MSDTNDAIKVIVAMDYSDGIIAQLRDISPRLRIERHFPNVPESAWADAEVLYTSNTLPEPSQAPRLRWIQIHSAGLDGIIDRPIIQAEDVEVTSASGVHAPQMAEYCLSMMLAFNYGINKMLEFQAKAEWPEKALDIFKPRLLRGQSLGIVGYGSIGRELARLANGLGMQVVATKRDPMHPAAEGEYAEPGSGDPEGDIPTRIYPAEALASMVSMCDYVVVTLPYTPATHHVIDASIFEAMKPGAVFINVGRGGVVDERDLVSALAAGKIAGAGLDVFETEPLPSSSPLWDMENVIISPHISGNSQRLHAQTAALFAENLQRYVDNQPLLNKLDRERGY